MMKHVQLSPYRSRADTVSLSSNASFASLSPEPFTTSRSSSYTSLNDPPSVNNNQQIQHPNHQQGQQQQQPHQQNTNNKTTIKVYARCLRPDIEYKTLSISFETTCREVVDTLLSKYRMKHRDPRLFYLSMEVTVRKAGVHTQIALDDDAKPAVLQSCHPKGDSRFSLQTRRGGLVKVYDSILNSNSQYKSLLISARTTCDELIALLLACYTNTTNTNNTNSTSTNTNTNTTNATIERVEQFSLYEVCPAREQQRKLHPDDKPLLVQHTWPTANSCHFLIKRNPDYRPLTRRKFPLTSKSPCELKNFNLTHYNNAARARILFEEKRKRERQEQQSRNYNTTKYSDLNQSSYADYENYFYI